MAEEQRSAQVLMKELKAELARASVDEPAARARLEQLIDKLDERLDQESEATPHELVDELREDVAEFEVAHPQLASTIRGFMQMLSSVGI